MTIHRYRIHGLTVASEIAMPDARACAVGETADVWITCAAGISPCERDAIALEGDMAQACLYLPEAATFDFANGQRITITPHCADPETLRTFLLGSAWAVLLHQRGQLPLHGCALEIDGAVWLFVGESGAGKSTMAAALLRAGARLVSDDVTVIEHGPGRPRIWPGLRSMKLAPSEANWALGAGIGLTFDGAKERIVPDRLSGDRGLELAAIVELARSDADEPRLHRLHGAQASAIAIRHTFRGLAVPMLGEGPRHFGDCVALARTVPFFRIERPWDAGKVAATANWLIAHGPAILADAG